MDLGLKGLRVVVTAGAGGIGLKIAKAFLDEGALVHICDVDRDGLANVRQLHRRLTASYCDVSDRASVAEFFADAVKQLGGIDCLVNNAGIAGPVGRVDEIPPEEWDRTLDVNSTGQFNCVRLAVPHLKSSENPSIVNMSSAAGRLGFQLRTPYAASKWAVVGFTKSLAMELGSLGIRVNAILPGIVSGERQDAVLAQKAELRGISFEEMKQDALKCASIAEFVSPRQIADTIVCLASLRFRTTTGQAIAVDGDLQMLS
ncbi:SDR family oxidoreductase [Aminobacter sp. AP02]|uniref:SDR family oxidoreductase n=1 Tax=Aminobacter sp. AP02 TaxID=2135737 RepID=UPI000D6BAA88|nr:SDR family oxidoreductase [Aminobacter sp. AP02]PWK65664.1 NAD(P)-dependent dehydrogenase (short-subunit alcohol dehydrogenase family) [Aminobacter sp. AP02]